MPNALVEASSESLPQRAELTREEFVRIGKGLFDRSDRDWKHHFAEIFGYSWNSIWSFANGRRRIPANIAQMVAEFGRMYDEAVAVVASRNSGTHDDTHRIFEEAGHSGDGKD